MTHKSLDVWKLSFELSIDIYRLTNSFPSHEKLSLIQQIRRCAISVPSNISEGAGRDSIKEYIRFLNISKGSLNELETQLLISKEIDYCNNIEPYIEKINRISKMIYFLKKSLNKKL